VTDACFGAASWSAFEEVFCDPTRMFTVYRCRAHDCYFMNHVTQGPGMYNRFILLGELADPSPEALRELWERLGGTTDADLISRDLLGTAPSR